MKRLLLATTLLLASISAQATTWIELATARTEDQIIQPVNPCRITEADPTIYYCIGFRLEGESFVAVLMQPIPESEILAILTTPSAKYPNGFVNPQELMDNARSAF